MFLSEAVQASRILHKSRASCAPAFAGSEAVNLVDMACSVEPGSHECQPPHTPGPENSQNPNAGEKVPKFGEPGPFEGKS